VIPLSSLDYNQNNQIGRGGSATVYEGKFSGRDVAVKVYWFDNPSTQSNKKLLLKEAAELLSLQHENIIKCFGVCAEIGGIILELAKKEIVVGGVTQYVHSLKQLIEAIPKEFFSMELRYAFLVHSSLIFYLILQLFFLFRYEALFQVASGLDYLHNRKITHGDLKSANVLVLEQDDWTFKLCDVGQSHIDVTTKLTNSTTVSASRTGSNSTTRRGTISFEAPEVSTRIQI